MALTNLISFSIRDIRGKRGQVHVYVPNSFTIAQIQTYVTALAVDVNAMTGGVVDSAQVTLALTLPGGLRATPVEDVFVSNGANWAFSAENTNYRHTIHIPAFNPSLIDGGEIVDAGGVIAAFEPHITAGDTVVLPSDQYGNDLTAVLGKSLSFRSG
jgi:hypothetical protein